MKSQTRMVAMLFIALFLAGFILTGGDTNKFGVTIVGGLFKGMLLFLVASGLSIIFGLMDVLNLAQGSYFMLGAYSAFTFHHSSEVMAIIPNGLTAA